MAKALISLLSVAVILAVFARSKRQLAQAEADTKLLDEALKHPI